MHEHSFIEAILRNVQKRASSEVAGCRLQDIKKVVLEVGELVGIEASHLREHMMERVDFAPKGVPSAQMASANTDKVGNIEVLEKAGLVRCRCGFEGRPKILERLHDIVVFECGECGGVPEVLEGEDIKIISITYK